MSNTFASGRHAVALCDICGFKYPLSELRALVVKMKVTSTLACPECWSPDHPQLQVGMYPVDDPQALRTPRPDPRNDVIGAVVPQLQFNALGFPCFAFIIVPGTGGINIKGA